MSRSNSHVLAAHSASSSHGTAGAVSNLSSSSGKITTGDMSLSSLSMAGTSVMKSLNIVTNVDLASSTYDDFTLIVLTNTATHDVTVTTNDISHSHSTRSIYDLNVSIYDLNVDLGSSTVTLTAGQKATFIRIMFTPSAWENSTPK